MLFDNPVLDALAVGTVLAAAGVAWIVVLVRLNGVRALTKMTNFDFVITLAMGSLLASGSQVKEWPGFVQVVAAMAALFAIQFGAAWLRRRSQAFASAMQNTPIILMRDGEFVERAMDEARVSRVDVMEKLRQANVLDPRRIHAVVLETTGDISVLHGEGALDPRLLDGVREL